jgi:hypothetical protein
MDPYEELRSLIALVRRRWRWLVALRTTARASAVLAMLLVVGAIDCRGFRSLFLPLRPVYLHWPLRPSRRG